ncbi:MAG: hypothetical protein ACK5B9_08480 [Flavobacteriia bacterium]|jgi:hypothetical protein
MKKVIILCFFTIPLLYFAQDYKSALGVKLGYPGYSALNGKFYMGQKFALDNALGVNFDRDNRFIGLQTLLEFNKSFGVNEGYNWYAGLGPKAMYYVKGGYLEADGSQVQENFFLKVDGAFGLEYTAPRTHLNAAFEFGPTLNVIPFIKIGAYANVAIRYAIKNEKFR